ncbi:MAG TPA: hypothetical protein VMX76_01360 [Nevskiaceae bacterium]|nr:hypothetical protein [Nevskiaceae bacterium]
MKQAKLPKVSVIIPVKAGREIKTAIAALRQVDYPLELIEVFISRGVNPSRQRNKAAKKAKGEILYFLDNDSEIEKRAFKRAMAIFLGRMGPVKIPQTRGFSLFPGWLSNLIVERFFSGTIYKGNIGAAGGPNVWWREEPFWASMAGIVLESFFVHFQMAARYRPIGLIHRATEKELILCNLAVRRDIFKKVGGFNESLYPNEENELLNRMEQLGYQLIYHPGVLVFRPRRQSFKALLNAFFHYGRGRMEQIRVEGVWQSLALLSPLVLLFYLLGLVFYHPWFAFLPLILYLGMGFGSALGFAARKKKPYLAIFLPSLFLIAHLSYALGLLYGLTTDLKRLKGRGKRAKIKVVKVKEFGKSWT